MNRNLFFLAVATLFIFSACNKTDNIKCPYTTISATANPAEVANLKTWLDTNALPYTQHPSGLFYNITNPGAGGIAGPCSNVTVKYIGRLTNGVAFDSSYKRDPNGSTFTLGQLITGWQIGIPLIKKGGAITLYIPPSLGYGASGSGSAVPPNSNLVFNIELLNVE